MLSAANQRCAAIWSSVVRGAGRNQQCDQLRKVSAVHTKLSFAFTMQRAMSLKRTSTRAISKIGKRSAALLIAAVAGAAVHM